MSNPDLSVTLQGEQLRFVALEMASTLILATSRRTSDGHAPYEVNRDYDPVTALLDRYVSWPSSRHVEAIDASAQFIRRYITDWAASGDIGSYINEFRTLAEALMSYGAWREKVASTYHHDKLRNPPTQEEIDGWREWTKFGERLWFSAPQLTS